jgi:hypothetical protein
MSHCPIGTELYRNISEEAHASQRSMHERRETTYQTLEAYGAHVRNCRTCRGLPEEDAAECTIMQRREASTAPTKRRASCRKQLKSR